MSTTLSVEEAQEALAKHWSPSYAGPVGRAFEALARAAAREEIARSRAPVGEDVNYAKTEHQFEMGDMPPTPPAKDTGEARDAGWTHEAGEELRRAYERSESISPLKLNAALRHGFEAIAVLEARLAEMRRKHDELGEDHLAVENTRDGFKRERDEARSSLETVERRIGELEAFAKSFSVSVNESSFYKDVTLHLVEPHALSIRLANSKSDKAWIFADLEARRLAALTPDAGTARSEDEEG